MARKRCCFFLILTLSCLISTEARGGYRSSGGRRSSGGYRSSSSGSWGSGSSSSSGSNWSSRSASARPTAGPSYSRNYAPAVPTARSSNIATHKAVNQPTTPRYVMRTQPTVQRSPSQVYQAQSYPSQRPPSSGYTTPRNGVYSIQRSHYPVQSYTTPRSVYSTQRSSHYPTQMSYPRRPNPPNYGGYYNQPNYGGGYRPNYHTSYTSYSPYYTPSYSKYPNLYQPVGKYKDHSVRNSIIAGLGGSALGMYLGYKLGSYTSDLNHPIGGYGGHSGLPSGYTGFPSYSVVHHYHHGERAIPQTFEVKSNTVAHCDNMTNFCMPNTTPICMTNGTIYCVAPISATANCNETKLTNLPCLNTTISVPCVNASDPNCHSGIILNETVAIPCISNISVYGDFTTNKLQVHHISGNNSNLDTTLTPQGIRNNFCVTVIADPVKVPERMKNSEFLWYLEDNPKEKELIDKKTGDVFQNVLNYIFY